MAEQPVGKEIIMGVKHRSNQLSQQKPEMGLWEQRPLLARTKGNRQEGGMEEGCKHVLPLKESVEWSNNSQSTRAANPTTGPGTRLIPSQFQS